MYLPRKHRVKKDWGMVTERGKVIHPFGRRDSEAFSVLAALAIRFVDLLIVNKSSPTVAFARSSLKRP